MSLVVSLVVIHFLKVSNNHSSYSSFYYVLPLLPAISVVYIHGFEIHDENSSCFSPLQLLFQSVSFSLYVFIYLIYLDLSVLLYLFQLCPSSVPSFVHTLFLWHDQPMCQLFFIIFHTYIFSCLSSFMMQILQNVNRLSTITLAITFAPMDAIHIDFYYLLKKESHNREQKIQTALDCHSTLNIPYVLGQLSGLLFAWISSSVQVMISFKFLGIHEMYVYNFTSNTSFLNSNT